MHLTVMLWCYFALFRHSLEHNKHVYCVCKHGRSFGMCLLGSPVRVLAVESWRPILEGKVQNAEELRLPGCYALWLF
jgi:hypothetical protein